MQRKEDTNRFYHMLQAARETVGYAQGRSREDLDTDRPLTHSLVRCLEIIGEAAGRVSQECREAQSGIAWNDIIGMRNRLIHGYFDINLNIVWKTVTEELPPLIDELERILGSEKME